MIILMFFVDDNVGKQPTSVLMRHKIFFEATEDVTHKWYIHGRHQTNGRKNPDPNIFVSRATV